MCGLISFLGEDPDGMRAALAAMRHRGVTAGVVRAGGWSLGRTRLPIVGAGLPEFDAPYRHEGWTFLFVGEVLNYKDFVPSARCDVEVLARLWVDEGPSCLRRFDGFWSVVAVPPHGGEMWVATDFLAKKPLYFRRDRLAFSSEIGPLAALGPTTADPVYFSSVRKFGYHVGERTWAREVKKLPPGALWRVKWTGEIERDDAHDVVEADLSLDLAEEIRGSVRRRVLSSDVPVAMLLSGGLDSALVYRLAEGLRSDMTIYHAPNDERDWLDLLDPKGRLVEVPDHGYDLDDVLCANEGPVDLGSMLPQYALGQAVEERVALSGDGADELFGGYRRAMEYDSQGSDVYDELVHYHLPRLDKMMMRGTVELRSPFLARNVLAGALALPRHCRMNKSWLRGAASDFVPEEIVNGPKHPLKSGPVLRDPVAWRMELCERFERLIGEGKAT